jgi:Phycobilisome degradation protein nblA
MKTDTGISVEQEFMLRVMEEQVKQLSLEETKDCLLEILRQSMVKENLFKDLLKNGL